MSFSGPNEAAQLYVSGEDDLASKDTLAEKDPRQHNDIRPTVLEFSFGGAVWQIKFGSRKGIEEHSFTDMNGFHAYKKLLSKPGTLLSPDVLDGRPIKVGEQSAKQMLDQGLWEISEKSTEEIVDEDAVKDVHKRIKQLQQEIKKTENSERLGELRNEMVQLQKYLGTAVDLHGEQRKWRTDRDKASNRILGQLLRARQKIEAFMPQFAEYLAKSVVQRGGSFLYLP